MVNEVVGAVIVQGQRILLGQRSPTRSSFPNVWDVFGGHVELGEQHRETLIRELREELDITPTHWQFLETLTLAISPESAEPSYQLYLHLYLVTAWSGVPVNRQRHEHADIQWFSLSQAVELDLAHPTYPQLFARYLASDAAP